MNIVTTIELPANAPAALVLAQAQNTAALVEAYGKTTKFGKAMIEQQRALQQFAASTDAEDAAARNADRQARVTAAQGPHAVYESDKATNPTKEPAMDTTQPVVNTEAPADASDAAEDRERDAAESPAQYREICASQGVEVSLNEAAAYFHSRQPNADSKGFLVETFAFGKTPIGLYWSNLDSEYVTYTKRGTRLSRSAKTMHHAKQGARNDIKRRQRVRKNKAANKAA